MMVRILRLFCISLTVSGAAIAKDGEFACRVYDESRPKPKFYEPLTHEKILAEGSKIQLVAIRRVEGR